MAPEVRGEGIPFFGVSAIFSLCGRFAAIHLCQRSICRVRFQIAPSGPLRKIFLQKKFEDPKMVGEFFSLPFDKVK